MDWARIRKSFADQGLMATLGAELTRVEQGAVEIALSPSPAISQQHGFTHGGAVGAIADNAAGFASMTVMPPGAEVLTVEYKINFLAPARGERIIARGRVVKPGRTLVVAQSEVVALDKGREKTIAIMTATMAVVLDRPDVKA